MITLLAEITHNGKEDMKDQIGKLIARVKQDGFDNVELTERIDTSVSPSWKILGTK